MTGSMKIDEPITTGAKNNLKVEENGKLTELE